jgi:hypothetical protein
MATKKNEGKNRYYSVSKKLRKEGKSSEEFEILLNNLSLEEVIGLKLELCSRFSLNGKMYGLPLWQAMPSITRDAVLKFALSATRTKRDAARFLGLTEATLTTIVRKYKAEKYFLSNIDT